MNIRIVAGRFGGRVIDAPDRRSTHAMSERGRNALFNSLSSDVHGAAVLDVFAGSGSLAFEAISRGAASAQCVEKDRVAAKIIEKNRNTLRITDKVSVVRAAAASWISTYDGDNFDIIFADPPYHDVQLSTVTKLFGLLKPNGLMVLSHPGIGEVPIPIGIVVVDNRSYGNLHFTFFRRNA